MSMNLTALRREALGWATLCLILAAGQVRAADINELYGKWFQRFPNGNAIATEFTPTTIATFAVAKDGKEGPIGSPQQVTYSDANGSTISVNFKGGGGLMVVLKDHDTIIVDFPGLAARTLTRH
jgi:hypothetical protein